MVKRIEYYYKDVVNEQRKEYLIKQKKKEEIKAIIVDYVMNNKPLVDGFLDGENNSDTMKLVNVKANEEYIGKIPKSANSEKYISNEIRILKEDLNRAVELEEYEKAADIRDRIKELEECSE